MKASSAVSDDALALKDKLSAQGAGHIDEKTAERYIQLVRQIPSEKSVVIRAVQLYYKSNGRVGNANNIVRIQKAEADAEKAKNATTSAKDDKMDVDSSEKEREGENKKKKKKKKSKSYKDTIREIKMARQTSEERRKAHKDFLAKNLGGGKFDKLDKI